MSLNRYLIDVATSYHSIYEVWAESESLAVDALFSGDTLKSRDLNMDYSGDEEVMDVNCYTREDGYGLTDLDITWINGEWKTKQDIMEDRT